MDVVDKVRKCLKQWNAGGEAECRSILVAPHCNPTDPDSIDTLTTAYHTLLLASLDTYKPQHQLELDRFVAFVQSVLDGLPSSSSSSSRSPHVAAFGEILVDMIWSVEASLDEIFISASTALATAEGVSEASDALAKTKADLEKTKSSAESDKKRLAEIARKFLIAGILDPGLCRERLDTGLLANAGLIPDKGAFDRKEIRMRTSLFYKQNKFNLLREQSEGYTKLVAEVTSSLGPPHSTATGQPTEPMHVIEERARPVWERVVSLIGYFDLDPNRALDVLLDVFSMHLGPHWSFFLALLSCSPWAPDQQRPQMEVDPPVDRYRGKSLDEVLLIAEGRDPATYKPPELGSAKVLAQVLGFKLRYYQSPEASTTHAKALYLMAALLIRERFITIEDLFSHITPDDEGMEKAHKEYLTSIDNRIAAAKMSQLALAAPLESGAQNTRAPPRGPAATEAKNAEPKPVPNQRLQLLNALLSVGALRPAFAIITKYPWLVDAHGEIADLVLRVLKHSINQIWEDRQNKPRASGFATPRSRYGASGVTPAPPRKPHITLWAPTPPPTSGVEFVFFYPDWVQRVPVCNNLDDLVDVIGQLMRFIGVHISRDPSFMAKLARLGRQHIFHMASAGGTKSRVDKPDPNHPLCGFWLKMTRHYLLPALSLVRGNALLAVDVYSIIRIYEPNVRWQLYGEWKAKTYTSHPELRIRHVQTTRESKGILRRLSTQTVDTLSSTIAKLVHSNPCVFFSNAVNQAMSYDNMAGVIVDSLKYVSMFAFDVLVYILLEAFAQDRNRVKDDGVNTSDWLQNLASFAGRLYAKYSADLAPLLEYIVHQLYNEQTSEIVVLRELTWKMAGVEPLPSLNESQITAMAGGAGLRIEAIASHTRGARLDPKEAGNKAPQRLGKALLDTSLAFPLLVQVARQRQACVFKAQGTHLKALSSLYDTTQGVLLQFIELLTSPTIVTPSDYATKVLPSLGEIGETYGISAPMCMQIIRPVLQGKILLKALNAAEQERKASEEQEKRLKAALTAKREPSAATSRKASPAVGDSTESDVKEVAQASKNEDVSVEAGTTTLNGVAASAPEQPWLPELQDLFDDTKRIIPADLARVVGIPFYLTFWQLSMYDLSPPSSKYDEECSALRRLSQAEDKAYTTADRSSDRSKRAMASQHRAKRERYNLFIQTLTQEMKEQMIARAFTIRRLNREKQHWFAHCPRASDFADLFVEHCLQPRCLLSPMDADFCAHIIKVIHTLGTPGFPTLTVYDKVIGFHVGTVLFSCSEYEAKNYGRFLSGILSEVTKWYHNEELWNQQNQAVIGGKTVLLPGLVRIFQHKQPTSPDMLTPFDDFRKIVRKWHLRLSESFKEAIDTGEFMHIYNSIIVLKEILPVYPLRSIRLESGKDIRDALEFLKTEERGDLKILGTSYEAAFKQRKAFWADPNEKEGQEDNGGKGDEPRKSDEPGPSVPVTNGRHEAATSPSGHANGRNAAPPPSAPSGPRAQVAGVNGKSQPSSDRTNVSRSGIESVPRPEVVKRIRPDVRARELPKTEPAISGPRDVPMDVDKPTTTDVLAIIPVAPDTRTPSIGTTQPAGPRAPVAEPPVRRDLLQVKEGSRPGTPNAGKQPPRSPRTTDERSTPHESQPIMPPPMAPSQTMSAQELRETARQSVPTRGPSEKQEEKIVRVAEEARNVPPSSAASSPVPRRRSASPPTRPGTRPPSTESRASGGRMRTDDRRSDRDRTDSRDGPNLSSRRESRNDRSVRDRESERDRERGRDRHSDRERDRDRERNDRERERERERERDRDRDRDRHRRDDNKDRERERERDRDRDGRKDRGGTYGVTGSAGVEDRGLPSHPERSDLARQRMPLGDDGLGKRRRPGEEDADRSSKRSSRHRDEKGRRLSERDGHDRAREGDRRRKERDGPDADPRDLPLDRIGDKRIPEGPSAKSLPPTVPSAPRAMAGDGARGGSKPDLPSSRDTRDRKSQRDQLPHLSHNGHAGGAPSSRSQESGLGSLRSRIGEKETPRSPVTSSPLSAARPELERSREIPSSKDDEREGSRKRTLSDRERGDAVDMGGPPTGPAAESFGQPPKRPRINRQRYMTNSNPALAKKLLPIDPQASDKTRMGRKD